MFWLAGRWNAAYECIMLYDVFYLFGEADESVSSEDPVRLDQPAITELVARLNVPGDFLGVVDANGVTLQIATAALPAPHGNSWQ